MRGASGPALVCMPGSFSTRGPWASPDSSASCPHALAGLQEKSVQQSALTVKARWRTTAEQKMDRLSTIGSAICRKKMGWRAMNKPLSTVIACFALFVLVFAGAYAKKAHARASQQYPILDALAAKVVQKYQTSTCEQLWEKRSQKAPPKPEEQKVLQLLHNDPQMRTEFINKVAAPIANKMFECGMIP